MEIEKQRSITNRFILLLVIMILGIPAGTYFYKTGYFNKFMNHTRYINECDVIGKDAPIMSKVDIIIKGEIYSVRIPYTIEEAKYGLMCETSLGKREGMLFAFNNSMNRGLWMKNTLISLDMIFMNKEGVIVGIIKNTKPLSTKILKIKSKSTMVLELAGGSSNKIGLNVGDSIKF